MLSASVRETLQGELEHLRLLRSRLDKKIGALDTVLSDERDPFSGDDHPNDCACDRCGRLMAEGDEDEIAERIRALTTRAGREGS
jgi:hypothetical protein